MQGEHTPIISHKRQRSEITQKQYQSTNDDDGDDNDENQQPEKAPPILTPHIVRLLKVLKEGTSAHAEVAASHIRDICRQSSPEVLWDILGRLQGYLVSEDFTSRRNAATAMEGVAACLPERNQTEFLESAIDGEKGLWLNVHDLAKLDDKHETGLQTILRKGRQLLVSSGNEFDLENNEDLFQREQSQLDTLDQSRGQQDFLEHRVRLQRQILAQRLGLAGVMDAVGSSVLPNEITSEDLIECSPGVFESKKCIKLLPKIEADDDDDDVSSIRALLVLEMQGQCLSQRGSESHKNPQTLLATELLYRMFDADWKKRQGAIMGILALLKAWNGCSTETTTFGSWPRDILTRCLCVLALDRFGDYGENMMAPVRQMAGQLLAVLYRKAPIQVQTECRAVLMELTRYDAEWEVRHGGIVGLTFIAALSDQATEVEGISAVAIGCLSDDNDDVKGAAATILMTFFHSNKTVYLIRACVGPLWKAISTVRSVASCAENLISLFSAMLCQETQIVLDGIDVGLHHVLTKLVELLEFESLSVKLASLQAIGSLTRQISALDSVNVVNALISPHYALMTYLFETHWNLATWTDDESTFGALKKARDQVWIQVVQQVSFLFQYLTPLSLQKVPLNALLLRLTLRYFGILYELHSWTEPKRLDESSISIQEDAANALAYFWVVMMKTFEIDQFVRCTVYSLIHSPWIFLCESACILHAVLCRSVGLLPWMETSHLRLNEFLQQAPVCMRYQHQFQLARNVHGFDHDLVQHLQRALQASQQVVSDSLIFTWTEDLSEVVMMDTPVGIAQMRLSAVIAGAIAAGGSNNLPAKLTPLVRALTTSIKSEADNGRREFTCKTFFWMLQSLSDEQHSKVKAKVLSNLCMMLVERPLVCSGKAAALVIKTMVAHIPRTQTIETIPPVWLLLDPLTTGNPIASRNDEALDQSLDVLKVLSESLTVGSRATFHVIESTTSNLVGIACTHKSSVRRLSAESTIKLLCKLAAGSVLRQCIPSLLIHLKDIDNIAFRIGACRLLHSIIEAVDMEICPFVRILLPVVMSLMADPEETCAKQASQTFAILVRVAPLVRESVPPTWQTGGFDDHSVAVMDHLIHGMPLPPCQFPSLLTVEMESAGISLRSYQQEGISWLRFLQSVKLNGALCDDMGVGKTVQALLAVALAHADANESLPCSLVVCPSTLVGLWLNEVKKFFPSDSVFRPFALVGNGKERTSRWKARPCDCNLVLTSYAVLRSDIKILESTCWKYCILDEGHLLKNPRTATAIAARRLRANHKLILTGTPVQNHVSELWATFDFLLPNFLGSQAAFSKAFARPIANSQRPGASSEAISVGMERLKILHQQVLPFILRREKSQVLKELPPKIVTDIPCSLSEMQSILYKQICESTSARKSLAVFDQAIDQVSRTESATKEVELGSEVFKTLLCLRLLCTHPSLVVGRVTGLGINDYRTSNHLEASGKLLALNDLLRTAGVGGTELTAADNDTSLMYVGFKDSKSTVTTILDEDDNDDEFPTISNGRSNQGDNENPKCLIFAQFSQSLDIVETLLFKPHMPSLRYLRLDGSIPQDRRSEVVDTFNNDDSIRVLLLTTRVGGLGLNLTSASMVIFLEHDYNPHADLQAADRCYRLGQSKTVNIYRLITTDTIEEKIRTLQKVKLAMSDAIVNTENSSMYSMGTDRLLDIFTFRSDQDDEKLNTKGSKAKRIDTDSIDNVYSSNEYESLSVQEFVKGFAVNRKN